jgi:hypothetical protein
VTEKAKQRNQQGRHPRALTDSESEPVFGSA